MSMTITHSCDVCGADVIDPDDTLCASHRERARASILKVKMMPGQEPYTPEEQRSLFAMVASAADDDPGEANEPPVCTHCGKYITGDNETHNGEQYHKACAEEERAPIMERKDTRSLVDLAQEVIDAQDACNLSGVVLAAGRAIIRIKELVPGGNAATDTHPIMQLWSDKIAHLTGMQFAPATTMVEAYTKVMDMISPPVRMLVEGTFIECEPHGQPTE